MNRTTYFFLACVIIKFDGHYFFSHVKAHITHILLIQFILDPINFRTLYRNNWIRCIKCDLFRSIARETSSIDSNNPLKISFQFHNYNKQPSTQYIKMIIATDRHKKISHNLISDLLQFTIRVIDLIIGLLWSLCY